MGTDKAEYILGSGGSGGPGSSWSSESLAQRRQSITQRTSGFAGFGLSFGRDADRPSSVATAEDTFLRDPQHNDANYTLRVEEWTFGREKADGSGPGLSGLTAGDVAAPTVGSGSSELWRCHVAGRFSVERFALLCSSQFWLCVVSVSNRCSWNIVLTPNFFLSSSSMAVSLVASRFAKTSPAQDVHQAHTRSLFHESSWWSRGDRT